MQSKMPDCCAAANCNQKSDQPDIAFFSFPLDPERCKQWLNNCQRPDLGTKTPEQLHQSYKLCAKHFDSSLLCQEGDAKAVLKDGAIPTIFDIKSKPEPQTYRRKRPGEPIAGEPDAVKKSKDGDLEESNVEDNSEAGENSAASESMQDDLEAKEDPHAKGKEILKLYFKETLALTGFSIGNNTSLNVAGPLGGQGTQLKTYRLCDDKVDKKEVMKFGEDLMREEIRNSLRHARFFSVLLQDVILVEGKEQIPVFIRTVTDIGFPQKHLIGFLPCDVDCESLFYMLLSEIRNKWGLRMEHCRGLTYLTTGAICQKMKELSSRILRDFPQVVLAPSDPYAFNMWLIRSMPMLSIQNVMSAVEEVATLMREIPLLWTEMEWQIFSTYGHIKGEVERIKDSCQGHWEYGINAFQTMLDILEPILTCLAGTSMKVELESKPDTAKQVAKLIQTLRNFNVIMTLVVLKNTLCCVSILNPSLRGTISISSTLQYTISNALKLLNKYLQEIAIHHRKWFSDAVGRAKKLGVTVALPEEAAENSQNAIESQAALEDYYRESLCRKVLLYLVDEVKRVFSTEMVRILRWLSLVPSYMADHNFSIRRDKVADANLNNLSRPDTFYDELGCWEVKWRHASKKRILPTTVFATLKIPDIGFYPNVQSLLRVLGTIPCVNAEADVYGQYDMVLDRYHTYMRETPADQRLCNAAFVYVNQDVHMNMEAMVESYVEKHPDILQLLEMDNEAMEMESSAPENDGHGDGEETQMALSTTDVEKPRQADCPETNKEALKSALQSAVTAAFSSQNKRCKAVTDESESGTEYVSKSEMKEVLRVCEDAVREGILSEVGNSFFSLFIDRVVRMGEVDYLPLFLRFVDSFDVMRLELLGFVEADLDCEAMSTRLFDLVTEWQLDLKYCRGQAYLGSGEVSYKLKAFACKVQEKHPLAICSYSSCYAFNTWWSRSIPVSSITRALDILEEVMLYFGSTPALEKQLDQVIGVGLRESFEKIHELQGKFCAVWMEKHDCYEVFVQMLEPLVESLEKIHLNKPQRWKVAESNKAGLLLRLLQDFDFIMPMVALKNASSFTRELSAGLQKDHFSAASQLCQINGIVATLNRVKTNIKVFHQNWFEEACALAQSLRVQIKLPDGTAASRDGMVKPATYYKEMLSMPLVDNLINAVKDHFSDDHKEALNFLSLVPCSVTVSYMFEILKSKPPLYINDLPDPDNFSTELSCWRVKWKTKMVAVTIPDTIFQTLRLPVMQYFANIATLLRIMCVLPSTALEFCGETTCHSKYQDYLKNTLSTDRTPCLAMLQVGTNFTRDLDRMVAQCLKITPKTLEGICLDQESKTILKNSEMNTAMEYNNEDGEEFDTRLTTTVKDEPGVQAIDTNGHSGDNRMSARRLFQQAARLARRGTLLSSLPKEDQDALTEELSLCHWSQADEGSTITNQEFLDGIVKSIREAILEEVQDSPFFSIITDKVVTVALKRYLPVYVRYVSDYTPKVELLGFLPLNDNCQGDSQAKFISQTLTDDWGLNMSYCRGQAYLRFGPESQSLRKLSMDFLESYPLAVVTPSESCGLAHWLAGSLQCDHVFRLLGIVEDLLQFFDQSPTLESKLVETVDRLLNAPREAFDESPDTCCSRWRKREDFFDALVETLEGILSCLDSVSANSDGIWSSTMALHAAILATAIRGTEFVVTLVILKNACAPLKNCSTVFRCGNPADIVCELEKIPLITESLSSMLANVDTLHSVWFDQAIQLVTKVSGLVIFPEMAGLAQSPEIHYRETITLPVLTGLIEEMKYNFTDDHLKALKVLSLLPTCGPLPVVPESPDQVHVIFQDELPEPDTAEQDLNSWAMVWREKYQDVSPPASISETLIHLESKSNLNVTTLLKRVAVLPNVSMECDLMKMSLNSVRGLLRNTVCRGSRTDTVMLLSHQPVFLLLEEIIDKCIEGEPESRSYLTKVKQTVDDFKLKSELIPVETNGSCKPDVDMDVKEEKPFKEDKPVIMAEADSENSVVQRPVFSFYSPSVREDILKELWDSRYFTVIIEQDLEINSEPYVPICIRYLDQQETQCEETLAFIPVTMDVQAFVESLEAVLSEKWGLNVAFCRGLSLLCTGSAGAQVKLAVTLFSQRYPQVICTLSSAISLNVWLMRTSFVASMGTRGHVLEELLHWFTVDIHRQTRLEDAIVFLFAQDEAKGNELRDKLNCKHWERGHEMLEFVVDILEAVTLCLGEMRHGTSGQEKSDVLRFNHTIQDFRFIFTLVALKNILGITKNISQGLQGKPLDMLHVVNNLPILPTKLSELKTNLDSCHQMWFTEAVALASKLQIHLLHPALLESLSWHYQETISLPAVDRINTEVSELFPNQVMDAMRCLQVVPYVLSKTDDNCVDVGLVSMFKQDLPDLASFSDEAQKWKAKWTDSMGAHLYLPSTVLDTLKVSDISSFSNVEMLLRILVVLPFSRRESTFRQGRRALQEFMQQPQRKLSELHPL